MSLATQTEVQQTIDSLALPKPSSINAATHGDGTLLSIKLGRYFLNQPMVVTWENGKEVTLRSSGSQNNFMAMTAQRNDLEQHKKLWVPSSPGFQAMSGSGLALSNVGVSLAVTTTIDGTSYAVLARRRLAGGANRLMLISGYVDAAKFYDNQSQVASISAAANVIANGAAEGAEEINVVQLPGWFAKTQVKGTLITQVANELRLGVGEQLSTVEDTLALSGRHELLDYHNDFWWRLHTTGLPPYIHNVFRPPQLTMDGVRFDDVGFQVHMHTNSGQIILGMDLKFDLANREFLSLLHAEDGPLSGPACDPVFKASLKGVNAPPDALATRLDSRGLILCKLDQLGQLTPQFFNFFEGSVVPASHLGDFDSISLSDAFVSASLNGQHGFSSPSNGTSGVVYGFVDRAEVSALEYFGIRRNS